MEMKRDRLQAVLLVVVTAFSAVLAQSKLRVDAIIIMHLELFYVI